MKDQPYLFHTLVANVSQDIFYLDYSFIGYSHVWSWKASYVEAAVKYGKRLISELFVDLPVFHYDWVHEFFKPHSHICVTQALYGIKNRMCFTEFQVFARVFFIDARVWNVFFAFVPCGVEISFCCVFYLVGIEFHDRPIADVLINPPLIIISTSTSATIASATGTMRGGIDGSWRPVIFIRVSFIALRSTVRCSLEIDGVGFTAILQTIGSPLLIPPRIPPALFVIGFGFPSNIFIGSFIWLPFISADLNPAPISTPFTAPMLINPLASSALSLSKTGSPTPAGIPIPIISTIPPTLSPSPLAAWIIASICKAASGSAHLTGFFSVFSRICSTFTFFERIPPNSTT